MLHLLPIPAPEPHSRPSSEPYAEAVSRLASVRHALRLVDDGFSDGPGDDAALAAAWPEASPARQRCFDKRSARLVGATAAGLEALLDERQQGREPNCEASRAMVEEIRRELREVAGLVLG